MSTKEPTDLAGSHKQTEEGPLITSASTSADDLPAQLAAALKELQTYKEMHEARRRLLVYARSHSLDEVMEETLNELEKITGSSIGFYHFVTPDQKSLTLQNWSTRTKKEFCKAAGKGSHYEMAKAGVWVDCVRQRKPVIHNDYVSLPHKKGLPPGHAPVIRELVVPVIQQGLIVAVLGVGNKPTDYVEQDVRTVSLFAELVWDISERKKTEDDLLKNARDLRDSQHLAKIGSWSLNVATNEVVWSEELYSMYGADPSLPPPPYTEHMKLFTPASWERLSTALANTISTGKAYELELETVTHDKSHGWMWVRGEAEFDPEGKVTSLHGATQDITERKRMEEQLREEDIRFRKLSANVPDLIYQFTRRPDGSYFVPVASAGIKNIFGCSPEDVLEDFTAIGSVIFPEDAARVINDIEYSAKHLTPFTCEFRVQIPGKQIQWILSRSTPERLEDGSVTWYGFNADITERKKTEEEMLEISARLSLATKSAKAGVWDWNLETNEMIWDARMLELYGLKPETFHGGIAAWKNGLHPEDSAKAIADCEAALRGERDFDTEFRVQWPNGTTVHIKADGLVLHDNDGKPVRMIGLNTDITARKKAEEELVGAVDLLERTGRMANVGGWELDLATTLVTYSQETARIHELSYPCEPEPLSQGQNYYPPEAWLIIQSALKAAIEHGTAYDLESPFITAKGRHIWVRVQGFAVMEHGKTVKLRGTFQEITERKLAEEREQQLRDNLERATRMESLGVLAGGVAHNLNNVLGPLVALPEIISEDLANQENLNVQEIHETLEVIRKAANRSASIVRDLVSLGRRGHYNLVNMNLDQIQCTSPDCRFIEQLKTAYPKVTFSIKPDEGALVISGDEIPLSRAVTNLVQNATESINEEGTVTIKTFEKRMDAPLSGYETVPEGDYAAIEVSDTGGGIGKEHISRIFEPFYTRKKKSDRSGSGLGLSVVHGIVKDHNGFIDVKSEVGKGSVFTLYLPLVAHPHKEIVESIVAPTVGGKERILIVDDEPSQRFLGRINLERLGYEVTEAEDGHQALAHFEKAKKANEKSPYDLLVMDMTMEEGFDGLDTYEAILKLYPNQKVIIASGHSEDGRGRAAVDLGAYWLAKPYQRDDLARMVRKGLDRD